MDEALGLRLRQMIVGYWTSQAVFVAAKLGIADQIAQGVKSPEAIAAAVQCHAPSLARLMRMLAGQGLFRQTDAGTFELTELGDFLRSDVPASQRWLAIMMGEEHYRVYGELLHAVQTGENAFERLYGAPIFDYLGQNPKAAAVFDHAMEGVHGFESAAMLEAYDFSEVSVVADIGGGNGSMLAAILQRYPHLGGVLYDMPGVVERARQRVEQTGVAQRCQIISGNFFESVPSGADCYLLRHIIHDWDDERSKAILSNVRRAMPESGRVLIIEDVLREVAEPSFGQMLDLTMMLIPGGKERTESEYRALLEAAGLKLRRVVPTRADISVVEAVV